MAEAIVGPLLTKLQEVVLAEAQALASVGDAIGSLRDKLMWLHALLHEIEQRRHDNSRFREVLAWQIREVAAQAEDAIDKFHTRADLSRRGWPRAVVFVVNFYTQIRVRHGLSGEIQSMNTRLEEIIGNSGKYGTPYNGPGSDENDKSWKQSASIRREWLWENSAPFEMMCRDDEKKKLKNKLMNESEPKVIYIVGDSGMGKRTLLRSAYEDTEIRDHFDVCFSVSFQPKTHETNIVQGIKKQLKTYGSLHKKRGESKSGSIRFLVWIKSPIINITEWGNTQLNSLCNARQDIKIMVSVTYNQEWMRNSRIKLEPLDEKDCLGLFDYTVQIWKRGTSSYINEEMEKVKKNVKDYTNGLPLSAITLAKFMIAMDNYQKWETAPSTMRNINDDKLKVILMLSIDDLPDELKLCLLYTAGFPENTSIDVKQLLRLWMAEGFLSPRHGMEPEQLGQCYLNELIHRGLLINKTSTQHCDDVHSVAIHEFFHQIFKSEGQRRSFMHVYGSGIVSAPDNSNTRRLALPNYQGATLRLGDGCSKLRTVVSFSHKTDDEKDYREDMTKIKGKQQHDEPRLEGGMGPLLKGSPYLRVIHLEGIDIGPCLPYEIGDMVHLRYLGVRCQSLQHIPSSIRKLGSLQTLDVRDTQVRDLPRACWKIPTLLHVLGDKLNLPAPSSLKKKNEKIAELFSLLKKKSEESTYLDYSLNTLETVNIQHLGRWKRRLRRLHRLHVVDLHESEGADLCIILEALSNLRSLSLSGKAISIDWFVSNSPDAGYTHCLKHVMSLELKGRLLLRGKPIQETVNLAGYNNCLLNLTHLVLRFTQVEQSFIDVIAKLPVLTELALLMGSYKGTEVVFCARGFRSLKELQLSGLFTLKTIMGPDRTTERGIRPILMDMGRVKYETHKDCDFCRRQPVETNAVQTSQSSSQDIPQDVPTAVANLSPVITQENVPTADTNLSPNFWQKSVLHEMITEAITNGQSTKTAIGSYITTNYGDPLVKILEHMEERGELVSRKQRNYKVYYAESGNEGEQPARDGAARQSPALPYPEKIWEVIDKNGSTKTAISINFRKKHGDDPLLLILNYMVTSGVLKKQKEKNYTTYFLPESGGNDATDSSVDNKASTGGAHVEP